MKNISLLTFCVILFSFLFSSAQNDASDRNVVFQDVAWAPDGLSIFYSYIIVKKDWSDFKPQNWKIGRTWIADNRTETVAEPGLYVSFFSDNQRITFSNNQDIYIKNIKSGKLINLTHHDAKDGAPAVSPDGKWIAFCSDRNGGYEVFLMRKNGKNITQLTHSEGYKAYNPAWSPDGKQLCYYLEKGDGMDQIHVINKDGSGDRNITNDDYNNIYPAWTQSGQILYAAGKKGEPTRLRIVDLATGKKAELQGFNGFFARQSPDGETIAFLGDQTNRGIFIANPDGSNLRQIVSQAQFLK